MYSIYDVKDQLGDDVAYDLIENFGGSKIYIPKNQNMLKETIAERNQKIHNYLNSGDTYDEVAERFSLTKKQIYNINASFIKNKNKK